jgi:hypothetical protein
MGFASPIRNTILFVAVLDNESWSVLHRALARDEHERSFVGDEQQGESAWLAYFCTVPHTASYSSIVQARLLGRP